MKHTKQITYAALIASLYILLTVISNAIGIANGTIQFRLSEALTILPVFTGAAIPGIAIGCFLSNIITGCMTIDVLIGTLASVIGALGTYYLGRKKYIFAPLSPILANTIIIPFVLKYVYCFEGSYFFFMLTIGIGETVTCGLLGTILYKSIRKSRIFE